MLNLTQNSLVVLQTQPVMANAALYWTASTISLNRALVFMGSVLALSE